MKVEVILNQPLEAADCSRSPPCLQVPCFAHLEVPTNWLPCKQIKQRHLLEAMQYRTLERNPLG